MAPSRGSRRGLPEPRNQPRGGSNEVAATAPARSSVSRQAGGSSNDKCARGATSRRHGCASLAWADPPTRRTIATNSRPTKDVRTPPPSQSRDPNDVASYDEALAKITIGGARPLQKKPIEISEYDADWPLLYAREDARIRSILGDRVMRIEHAGSTAVSGLPAKPVIDIVLEVPDSAAEPAYVPDLEAAGYVLRIREPEEFEHRMFKGPDTNVHLHVFTAGCAEVDRMLLFRDWLRTNARDRELYAATKRELAARDWKYGQQYADAKTAVVNEIMARAEAASG